MQSIFVDHEIERLARFTPPSRDAELAAPPTPCAAYIHPRAAAVIPKVDNLFLENWEFRTEAAKQKFLKAGFSRVSCLYFPLALDDRIEITCRLVTILFLIDDTLEELTLGEGEAHNAALERVIRGEVKPEPNETVPWMMHEIWKTLRHQDSRRAEDMIEPLFIFMRAQTDRGRTAIKNIGPYLDFRHRDNGSAFITSLMRYSSATELTAEEDELVRPLEANCSKHISVVNDICSWDKELQTSMSSEAEGSGLCSAVQTFSSEMCLPISATKRILWEIVREWGTVHDAQASALLRAGAGRRVAEYLTGLKCQMTGNEEWSRSTRRYVDLTKEEMQH